MNNVDGNVNEARHQSHDDLSALLKVLPPRIYAAIEDLGGAEGLLEVVLDLGRRPEARFADRSALLDSREVAEDDIDYVVDRISPFGDDNRAGIERTLHRISAIRNRSGRVVGLTCRVGRAIFGMARLVEDLAMSDNSMLLLGRPGVGKTTMLRELARVLADTSHKRVVVVDTSNEIAGDGDIPHPAIGSARRMQVATPALQHAVMIEAVENHMPEVIIIDEMGTELEALAARTIAERGVQLIATAHGNTLQNLLLNPTLSDLVGGVQTATLGDEEARRRHTQKTILERKAPPTFGVLVEIQSWDRVAVHNDVARTVDTLLRGRSVTPEIRQLSPDGHVTRAGGFAPAPRPQPGRREDQRSDEALLDIPPVRLEHFRDHDIPLEAGEPMAAVASVHPFGVSRERLEQVAAGANLPFRLADTLPEADVVLTTKSHFRRKSGVLKAAEDQGKPVFVLRRNTPAQIRNFLEHLVPDAGNGGSPARRSDPIIEAEEGVEQVLKGESDSVALLPQSAYVRRLQHRIAERANLRSWSTGREPRRRVFIGRG